MEALRPDILTASGHYFDFTKPEGSRIEIEDIAHALSHLCRFTGHVREFYSVAQHSVIASLLVPEEDALHALLHDAAEAYIGDVSRPLKALIPDYREIEAKVEAAVLAAFGLAPTMPASVKRADLVMLATEKRDLMHHNGGGWKTLDGIQPCAWKIWPWPPRRAYAEFMCRYLALCQEARKPGRIYAFDNPLLFDGEGASI